MDYAFGIDFGTTNSLASVVVGDRLNTLSDQSHGLPHPSVLWYRGGEVIVGRDALAHMDLTDGGDAPVGFVRSPKMALRRQGPMFVEGRAIDPVDAVSEVLKHLKRDAAQPRGDASGYSLARAVMTIPVDFGGPERRALRAAARKAGIGVIQFVHEPVAALYAHIRSKSDFHRELGRLDGRPVLVFDWGGGTLDVTLCRIQSGSIMQMVSLGDNEIGGDHFDSLLRNFIRIKHSTQYGIEDVAAIEQPGMAAKLLRQCEQAKIRLSDPSRNSASVLIRDYLRSDGPARHLAAEITRAELQSLSAAIIARGLGRIDEILDRARLDARDIELCLATGGLVNMPSIRDGLTERFLGRVPPISDGDSIISKGAAWIAHDGLRLTLSKPIEILVADTSGSGTYHSLVDAGFVLPVENKVQQAANTRLFCTDPREGFAVVEIAKPISLGRPEPTSARQCLCTAKVAVDPTASPLVERIECLLEIDHDYVAKLTLRSTGMGETTTQEFHDLDFGLSLPLSPAPGGHRRERDGQPIVARSTAMPFALHRRSNLMQRTNVAVYLEEDDSTDRWRLVPGDLVERWRDSYFSNRDAHVYSGPTARQEAERNFYRPCVYCKRLLSRIRSEGEVDACASHKCGITGRSDRTPDVKKITAA